jgi:hypothetical protein
MVRAVDLLCLLCKQNGGHQSFLKRLNPYSIYIGICTMTMHLIIQWRMHHDHAFTYKLLYASKVVKHRSPI